MGNFDIKNMTKLDVLYEKKLLVVAYYVAILFAVVGMFVTIVDNLIFIFGGFDIRFLWNILSSPFILIFQIIIIRVIAEVIATFFDSHKK